LRYRLELSFGLAWVKVMNDEVATPDTRVTAASEIVDCRAPQTIEAKMTLSEEFEFFVRSLNAKSAAPMIASVIEGEIAAECRFRAMGSGRSCHGG